MSNHAEQPRPDHGRDPSVAARVEQLYERHAAVVRSICWGLLRDRVEAEDAMQQTFLSAQRALLNGSSPRDEAAWLATIARHESLARVRDQMREPLPVDIEEHDGGAPDAHTAALRRHEAVELRDALAELPPQQREAILLRELRGFSYQEVAAALSVTTAAVESLLFRARRSLQARLQGALASLSPAALVQSLRGIGGGVAAPAAAKVAAVGLGAALFAGGALGPKVLGLGHSAKPARHASRPVVHHVVRAAPSAAPVRVWRVPAAVHTQKVVQPSHHDSSPSEVSDEARSSDRSEGDGPAPAGSTSDDGGDRSAPAQPASGSSGDSAEKNGGGSDDGPRTTTTSTTTTTTTTVDTTYPGTTND
jgi:RNA polymerase sigma-70 factor (ECF subfamily)